MALEIIGAGFGRTGTTSLRVALEHLGFVKCHHMMSLQEQRSLAKAWHDVALEGARNWDEIFEGFRATVDWPSTAYYKELMAHYPAAKVVLTVRDPDAWYQSAAETIFAVDRHIPRWLRWIPQVATVTEMVHAVIRQGELQGRFEDPRGQGNLPPASGRGQGDRCAGALRSSNRPTRKVVCTCDRPDSGPV